MKDQVVVNKPKKVRKTIVADTIISIVLDMSGSMSRIAEATREGLNAYLESQKEGDDKVLVMLTVFDSGWNNEVRINTILNLVPIETVPEITVEHYAPNGGTPLYDAIGTVVVRTEESLERIKGNPDVLFVLITDGDNNTSKSFTDMDAKQLIEAKQGHGWTPVYLGANQNAWAVSQSLGISGSNSQSYAATNVGIKSGVFEKLGKRSSAHRMAKTAVYESNNAMERGLVGSYTTTDFFSGSDDNVEEMVLNMTTSASLGDVEVTSNTTQSDSSDVVEDKDKS